MASVYRLTGKLEGGELAELYRAERDAAQSVVVKLFHERTSVKGYAKEIADTSNKLVNTHHPGISHVIDVGLVKRRLAIVREDSGRYTLGQALQRLNTKEVVITPPLAMALIIDLVDAVSEVHAAGVVHGAMTPGNVLLSAEGRPSICDFGALAALNAVPSLKKNFAARGRSAYRAPELIIGEPLTVQSDLYSLGAMTYELLTLREAAGESAQVSTRREALPPPSRIDRRLNSRIDPIILRALDPVPGRRYKNTFELAAALREFLTGNGGLPPRDELKRFVEQLFPKDVQLEPSPQVPFTEPFTLDSVEGADIDAIEERSIVLSPRARFSGSLEDMPAIVEPTDERTNPGNGPAPSAPQPTSEPSTDWHAPEAPMPQTARSGAKEALNADILKRVKHIEDFEQVSAPDVTEPERALTQDALPRVFPGRPKDEAATEPKASTVASPAESQPITAESAIVGEGGKKRRMITEERNVARAEAKRKKWIPLVVGSALAAVAFLLLGTWRWSAGRAVQPYEPSGHTRSRPITVKQRPAQPPPPPPQPARVEPPPSKPVVDNCYGGPRKGAAVGYVSISSTRPIAVVVDGDTVCTGLQKIALPVGTREITIIDTRTKEQYSAKTRVEAGKVARLIPYFKSK